MMKYIFVLLVLKSATTVRCEDKEYRLNTDIEPSRYVLKITPFFSTGDKRLFTFDGIADITFNTKSKTKQIKLHSDELEFGENDIKVFINNESNILPLDNGNPLTFDKNHSFVYINLANDLSEKQEYHLKISYKGKINEKLNGFYRNSYMEDGVLKWLGSTQFEPVYARKAFPCFDEPSFKAIFRLTIEAHPSFKTILSNTKVKESKSLDNGNKLVTFEDTPRMSTYLLAFLVSEYENSGDDKIGVYTRPEAKNQSAYAFKFAKEVVSKLGEYFGIGYDISGVNKLDHIAIVNFKAGAMENWGHITYRESRLMYVPEESAPINKYTAAQIIAHETTHQWFGNLVTCHWWGDTWLNEGFATYFQDFIAAMINPELGSSDRMVISSLYKAYIDDEANDPKAVSTEVNSPSEIQDHFDFTSYQKAGSILRMIHNYIGEDAFKFGINNYLVQNKFGVGYPKYVYKSFQKGVENAKIENIDVESVMKPWITQPGHPILIVELKENKVILTQERFYSNSSKTTNETYPIPISYTYGDALDFNPTVKFVMFNKTHSLDFPANASRKWLIFNIHETGLYRVTYDDATWKNIIEFLKTEERTKIHYLNRAKVVNDLFALYFADKVQFDLVKEALEAMKDEDNFNVFYAVIQGLKKLKRRFSIDSQIENKISELTLDVVNNIYNKLGYFSNNTDNYQTVLNRIQILGEVCKLDHKDCVKNALLEFKEFRVNGTKVPPSHRSLVYCTGLRYGSPEDFEFLYHHMMTRNVINDALVVASALGCTSSTDKIISYLLTPLKDSSPIKSQDRYTPLYSVLSNRTKVPIVFESIRNTMTLWNNTYETLESLLKNIASNLMNENEIDEFESWLSSCKECSKELRDKVEKSLQESRNITTWARKHESSIKRSLGINSALVVTSSFILLPFVVILSVMGVC